MSLRAVTRSPFFAPNPPLKTKPQLITSRTPNGTVIRRIRVQRQKDHDEEAKSSIMGASFNLINAIVGAGIVGIPFAIRECGLVWGVFMVVFCAALTEKSLRLLVETAKHVDVSTYERLCEASFGRPGFLFISFAMFIVAYGAMVSYLMIVKGTLPSLLGVDDDDEYTKRAILTVSSMCFILPLSLQRDMDNLSITSTISVIFDFFVVLIVAIYSPIQTTVQNAGGLPYLLHQSLTDIELDTFFLGIGVLSFAFVCQHSAFIIAGSLDNPTRSRWNTVSGFSLSTCAVFAIVMGVTGYLGYLDQTQGNVLTNLGMSSLSPTSVSSSSSSPSSPSSVNLEGVGRMLLGGVKGMDVHLATAIARGLLCTSMFFVYPMELFVTRHVCVVLLFKGRRAHEGDDHSVLSRPDRRIALTVALYISSLIPAILFNDLGSVFAITGAVGGSSLSYIGPGLCYIAVHGDEFIKLISKRWDFLSRCSDGHDDDIMSSSDLLEAASRRSVHSSLRVPKPIRADATTTATTTKKKWWIIRVFDGFLWYAWLMPIWYAIAVKGQKMMKKYEETEATKSPNPHKLGNVIHHKLHYRDIVRLHPPRSQTMMDHHHQHHHQQQQQQQQNDYGVGSIHSIRGTTDNSSVRSLSKYADVIPTRVQPTNSTFVQPQDNNTIPQQMNLLRPSSAVKVLKYPQSTIASTPPTTSQIQSMSSHSFIQQHGSFDHYKKDGGGSNNTENGNDDDDETKPLMQEPSLSYSSVSNVQETSKESSHETTMNSLDVDDNDVESNVDNPSVHTENDEKEEVSSTITTDTSSLEITNHLSTIPSFPSERSQVARNESDIKEIEDVNSSDDDSDQMDQGYKNIAKTDSLPLIQPRMLLSPYSSVDSFGQDHHRELYRPITSASSNNSITSQGTTSSISHLKQYQSAVSITHEAEGTNNEVGEDDPQDNPPSALDFVTAVFFIIFGTIAASAGLFSVLMQGSGSAVDVKQEEIDVDILGLED